ncbi:MAG: toll/interleukin-1 receptor domain-containing protein [Acidobacteria bacterium]|nr:toll/interleukin-1 receptor domain-containing protein [Acidobacteriota bacterium]
MSYYHVSQIGNLLKYADARAENARRKILSHKIQVFLSHSHDDADIILPVLNFLLSHGVNVYVDWLDEAMPKATSGETADRIKTKIVEADHFVVLLTENSRNSKWVPWELGYADGKKRIQDIGILPLKRSYFTSDGEFDGLEYLNLYPVISSGTFAQSGLPTPVVFPPKRIGGSGRVLGAGWLEKSQADF